MSSLGDRIRRYRRAAGLSVRELAASAGVSHSSLSRLERGILMETRSSTLVALSQCLGVTLDDLVHGDREPEALAQADTPEELVETYPFPAYVTKDDLIAAVNQPLLALTGFAREELVGSRTRHARFVYPSSCVGGGEYLGITQRGEIFAHATVSAPIRQGFSLHVLHVRTQEAMDRAMLPMLSGISNQLEVILARLQSALRYLGVRGVGLSVTRIPSWETHYYHESIFYHLSPEEEAAREPQEFWQAMRVELERCYHLGIPYDRYPSHTVSHAPIPPTYSPRRIVDVPIIGGTLGVGWAGDLTPVGFVPFLKGVATSLNTLCRAVLET